MAGGSSSWASPATPWHSRRSAPRRSPSIPDEDRITDLRGDASRAGVSVECHRGELADLGFAPSGTIDLVIANHTLDDDDDLGRTLRQVHRVLKPGAPLVLAMAHPFAAVGTTVARYGDGQRTVGDLLTALARTNFRIEAFHEVGGGDESAVPTTLVVKTAQARFMTRRRNPG